MMITTDLGALSYEVVTIVLERNATENDLKRIMESIKADVFIVLNASAAPGDLDMLYYLYFALRSHLNGTGIARDPNMEAIALSQCTLHINDAAKKASPVGHQVITIAALSRTSVSIGYLGSDKVIGSSTRFRKNYCSRQSILLKIMEK
ncbi:MAG: hypothetical protein RXQ96_04845 [Thermocladium sp.]